MTRVIPRNLRAYKTSGAREKAARASVFSEMNRKKGEKREKTVKKNKKGKE